ncbi:MAG: glycerophosphodiester phosphodiesterase [Oscillospiraceae bacterium]|nr:glycerophosphodiester phosphodiesterase [Oscillospiraceae bacterium]
MWYFIIAILALALFFLFSLHGRMGHSRLRKFRKFAYAHRGLHSENVPENSMAAFRAALERGYGAELDVHLLKDGNLAVIHDHSLLRTAGADVQIEDLTAADLNNYRLENGETIPLFSEVLTLWGGKTPLIIELKPTKTNHAALTDTAVAAMAGYAGAWCMESFDPRCVHHLKKQHPQVIRGQLSENFVRNPESKLPFVLKWVMALLVTNFLTSPDFVAYKFADSQMLSFRLCRKLWRIPAVAWTIQSQEDFDAAIADEQLPIFEGFLP